MKKHISLILIAITVCLLFVACNADADHGIYYQLASSYNKSSYEITGYMGKTGDGTFYYYNSNGVYSFKDKEHTVVVETSSENGVISHACLIGSDIYWQNRDGYIYKGAQKLSENSFSHLWENGYATSVNGLYKVTDLNTKISDKEIEGSLIYGDSIIFWDSENSYIYDGSSTYTISGVINFNGFIKYNGSYYVTKYLTLAKVVISGATGTLDTDNAKTFGYTLQDGGNIPMFTDGTYLYLKFSNMFYKYSTETVESPEITGGWAQSIANTTVVSVNADGSDYYIATSESGLYKVNLSGNCDSLF